MRDGVVWYKKHEWPIFIGYVGLAVALLLDWADRGLLRHEPIIPPASAGGPVSPRRNASGPINASGPSSNTSGPSHISDVVITFLREPDARMREYECSLWDELQCYKTREGRVYLGQVDRGFCTVVRNAGRGARRYCRYSKERVFTIMSPFIRLILYLISLLPVYLLGQPPSAKWISKPSPLPT